MTQKEEALSSERIAQIIEGILFVSDRPVALAELAKAVEISRAKVEKAIQVLQQVYDQRGLCLQRSGSQIQLATKADLAPYIERFLGHTVSSKLSLAAMEVLGIIAYKQPLTRSDIEAIRGVNCDGVLRTLLGKGLIEEVGRLDTVGHPIQYGTTFEFLQYFGLTGLDHLPALEIETQNIPQQAEAA